MLQVEMILFIIKSTITAGGLVENYFKISMIRSLSNRNVKFYAKKKHLYFSCNIFYADSVALETWNYKYNS